jgi:hypothetical protein
VSGRSDELFSESNEYAADGLQTDHARVERIHFALVLLFCCAQTARNMSQNKTVDPRCVLNVVISATSPPLCVCDQCKRATPSLYLNE